MFFPISDDDSKLTSPAYVTYTLLVINIGVFVYQVSHPDFTSGWSVIPYEITTGVDLVEPIVVESRGQAVEIPQKPGPAPIYLTLLTSMFMHAGIAHIFGNMLYLWIFGDNVELRFGPLLFLVFYLGSGLIASLCQIAINPDGIIPNLGASGAIWGVLGAYLVLFPHNKVNAIIGYFIVTIPAIFVIGLWALTQLFMGYGALFNTSTTTGGVAYMAHVGGLVAGVIMGLVARFLFKEEPDSILYRQYRRDPDDRRMW